jgi:hypothetical protein
MVQFVNRAKVATATTGTGTLTLGAVTPGYQTFAAAGVLDGSTVRYVIEDGDTFEIGTGVFDETAGTLTRVLSESSTGSLLDLTGGASVFVTAGAEDLAPSGGGPDKVFYENDQTVTFDYTIPADKNAMSTGPVTIDDGVTVTVSTGSRYVVI